MNDKLNRRLLILAMACFNKNFNFLFMPGLQEVKVEVYPFKSFTLSIAKPDYELYDKILGYIEEAPCRTN